MSVAATEAETLDEVLGAGLDGLSRRFYARARKLIDIPWAIATGEDLRFPQVEGRRPPGSGVVNATSSGCMRLNLLAPPTALMAPRIAWRVLARRAPAAAS